MVVWVLREVFEDSPRAVVFGTRKEALQYGEKSEFKRNWNDKYGWDLSDDEYSINKESSYMEREC